MLAVILLPGSIYSQGGIKIQSGANLVVGGTAQLVIKNGGLTNDGTFTPGSGTVNFTGNAATANSFIAGTSATNFYNLLLNKTSNGLLLSRNIGVNHVLTFTNGDSIYLNNFNIDLGSTGSLASEANASRITGMSGGYIQSTQVLNAPVAVNPGNLGFEITSLANLGSTIVRRGHIVQPGGSISRYYTIIPSNNSALDATVTFHYLDNELYTLNEGLLQLFTSYNAGGSWASVLGSPADVGLNTVTSSGLSELYMYTLAEPGAVLPIHLVSFDATLNNKEVLLSWSSDYESALDRYDVERSADGIHFYKLGSVTGVGNSSVTQFYHYADVTPLSGVNYYRLKVVDKNTGFVYSKVVLVKLNASADLYLNIYPNPVQNSVKLVFASEKNEVYKLQLFNALGVRVETRVVNAVNGLNNISLDIQTLPAGIYTIQLTGNTSKFVRFIKE